MNKRQFAAQFSPVRPHRVAANLNRTERTMLRRVRRYVKSMSGYDSYAEALRFLIRDWRKPMTPDAIFEQLAKHIPYPQNQLIDALIIARCRAILAESRPSSEPTDTAGGPGRLSNDALRAIFLSAYDKPNQDMISEVGYQALYDAGFSAGERAERERNKVEDSLRIQDDIRGLIAERVMFAFHIYPNYRVDSGGPYGCLMEILRAVRPDIAEAFSDDGDASRVYERFFDSESGEAIPPAPPPPAPAQTCRHCPALIPTDLLSRGFKECEACFDARRGHGETRKILGMMAEAEKCPEPLPEQDYCRSCHKRIVVCQCRSRQEQRKRAAASLLRSTQATGTADPPATGQGAEVGDEECEPLTGAEHEHLETLVRKITRKDSVLIRDWQLAYWAYITGKEAGAASQQKKLEAFAEALRGCVTACLRYQDAPMAEDRGGLAATRCADDISRIVLVATLRRELSAGRDGGRGEEK